MEFALCQFDLMEMIGKEVEIQRKKRNVILELDELINNQKRVYGFYKYGIFMNHYKTGLVFLWCDYLDPAPNSVYVRAVYDLFKSWDEEIAEDDPNYIHYSLDFLIDDFGFDNV